MRASITADIAENVDESWSPARAESAAREEPRSWLQRLTRRRTPSLFHRCLAIHIANATDCTSAPEPVSESLEA